MTWPSRVMFSLRMTERPVKVGFRSSDVFGDWDLGEVDSGVERMRLLRSEALLRSRGVSPRLFLISALFSQNSSMMSAFLAGVSSEESLWGSGADQSEVGLESGVEVTAGTGWVRTGELEVRGEDGSWQGRG